MHMAKTSGTGTYGQRYHTLMWIGGENIDNHFHWITTGTDISCKREQWYRFVNYQIHPEL